MSNNLPFDLGDSISSSLKWKDNPEKKTERRSHMPEPNTVTWTKGHPWISVGPSSAVWDLTLLGHPDLGTCSVFQQPEPVVHIFQEQDHSSSWFEVSNCKHGALGRQILATSKMQALKKMTLSAEDRREKTDLFLLPLSLSPVTNSSECLLRSAPDDQAGISILECFPLYRKSGVSKLTDPRNPIESISSKQTIRPQPGGS